MVHYVHNKCSIVHARAQLDAAHTVACDATVSLSIGVHDKALAPRQLQAERLAFGDAYLHNAKFVKLGCSKTGEAVDARMHVPCCTRC